MIRLNSSHCWSYVITLMALFVISGVAYGERYLIKQATVYTASDQGKMPNTDILIENGKIAQVGSKIQGSPPIEIIDATGKYVTPGLINASTHIGLIEIEAVSSTDDTQTTVPALSAAFDIAAAINMHSTLVPHNRINGLTRAVVMPRSEHKLFEGLGAAIALHSDMRGITHERIAQFVSFGDMGAVKAGGSRAAALQLIDRALDEAAYLQQHESDYRPGYNWTFSQPLTDLKALYPVLAREIPLVVTANRQDDIVRLIKLANKHQVRLVISGGAEAWTVAAQLAAAKVPIILNPMENLPQFESLSVRLDGAARLHRAGVTVLLTGPDSHNGYLVRQSAGNAVAYGLPPAAAIAAMTINTARVFSINNYGQIKAGMDADIVVWDADPLEVTSNPDMVMIQGKKQPMVSRATRLRDRYWQLDDTTKTAYRR